MFDINTNDTMNRVPVFRIIFANDCLSKMIFNSTNIYKNSSLLLRLLEKYFFYFLFEIPDWCKKVIELAHVVYRTKKQTVSLCKKSDKVSRHSSVFR